MISGGSPSFISSSSSLSISSSLSPSSGGSPSLKPSSSLKPTPQVNDTERISRPLKFVNETEKTRRPLKVNGTKNISRPLSHYHHQSRPLKWTIQRIVADPSATIIIKNIFTNIFTNVLTWFIIMTTISIIPFFRKKKLKKMIFFHIGGAWRCVLDIFSHLGRVLGVFSAPENASGSLLARSLTQGPSPQRRPRGVLPA